MPIANLKRAWKEVAAPEHGKPPIDYFDIPPEAKGCRGLGLRVSASGGRSWFVSYYGQDRTLNRDGKAVKKKVRLVLGPAFDYASASKRANEIILEVALVRSGDVRIVDPAFAQRVAKLEAMRKARGVNGFERLASQYIEFYAKPNKRSWREDERRIAKYLNPAWGALDPKAVTRAHVRALLDQINAAGALGESNRVLALVSKIFTWAIRRGYAESNPGSNHDVNIETPRTRYLDADEIKVIWKDLATDKYERDFADLCKLGLLTGQRLKSLRGLQWSELDLTKGWMTIPASRMKQKKKTEHDHRVPLVGLALEILRARVAAADKHEKFVFPARRRDAKGEIGYLTKINAWSDLQDALRTAFPDAASEPEYIDPTFHDFRRTLSTHVNEMHDANLSLAVEHVLDHVVGTAISRVYNVSDNFLGKREALIAWNEFICALVGEKHVIEASNVIPLRAVAVGEN